MYVCVCVCVLIRSNVICCYMMLVFGWLMMKFIHLNDGLIFFDKSKKEKLTLTKQLLTTYWISN